ncbi:MAG TPA: DUF6744 family protein [Candidatus Sulfotelmatobacter sp.]|nr:DUF6744 family protein [Candidatus Sulfotelmatobacter sp.]
MSLDLIRSHTLTAGQHVGDLLWWTLADARISRSLLESIWRDAGLSSNWLPDPPTPEKALRAAVRESQVGQPSYLLRLGKEDDHEIVFAVVLESRDPSGNVHHSQEARVRLDRHAPAKLDSDDPGHALVVAIYAAYDRLLATHTVDDVRRAVLKTLDSCAAVTLRDHGGVYWVPSPHAETLRHLQSAVSMIGSSRLDVVPIHATPEAISALGSAARASIEDELAALRSEIEGFVTDPPGRASTLARRLETFEDLRSRARLYHSVLQVHVQDLDGALTKLAAQVEGLLQNRAA